MPDQDFQPRIAFRMLKMIFYSLNAGLLIFFMVIVYLNDLTIPELQSEVDILTVVNIILLGSIPAGYALSGRRWEAIDPEDPFPRKFEQFQTGMILRWAMIEGAALFSLIGLLILQDSKHLILFILCLLVLSSNSVTREKVVKWAKLNSNEAEQLKE